ncbi:MAG TPA: DUF4407 domain-containing protein, partial [Xanthobacteraceae bacterium]|nr:DUF4407 domain-containing protein [Xanthobacteraceae bacterium]
ACPMPENQPARTPRPRARSNRKGGRHRLGIPGRLQIGTPGRHRRNPQSSWHLSGIQEITRGGLDVSGGPAQRIKAVVFFGIRILLSLGLAQLTAIAVSLLVFSGDINTWLQNSYLNANQQQIAVATKLVDGSIQRATDAVKAQTDRVNALAAQVSSLRQNEIDPLTSDPRAQEIQGEITRLLDQQSKADEAVQAATSFAINESGGIRGAPNNSGVQGQGPRYRAAMEQVTSAKARADEVAKALEAARARLEALQTDVSAKLRQQTRDQLPAFEGSLKAESDELGTMKAELATLIADREGAIRRAVESSLHVKRQTGFLTQIVALEHIADEDKKIALVILLIEFVSLGFELAAVLAKVASYVPTTYATLLARDAYMTAFRVVDEMVAELNAAEPVKAPDTPNPTQTPPAPTAPPSAPAPQPNAPQPPKRKRGRPRKHPLPDAVTAPNGQDHSAQPQDPPAAA